MMMPKQTNTPKPQQPSPAETPAASTSTTAAPAGSPNLTVSANSAAPAHSDGNDPIRFSIFFTLYSWIAAAIYALVLWGWFVSGPSSAYHTTQLANELQTLLASGGVR